MRGVIVKSVGQIRAKLANGFLVVVCITAQWVLLLLLLHIGTSEKQLVNLDLLITPQWVVMSKRSEDIYTSQTTRNLLAKAFGVAWLV